MAGGGSSSSSPVNMTPKVFENLQGPFASVIASLLGVTAPGGPSNGTGWGPNGQGGYAQAAPGGTTTTTTSGNQFGGSGGTRGSNTWRNSGNGGFVQPRPRSVTGNFPQTGGGGSSVTTTTPAAPTSTNPNDILNGIPTYQGPLTAGIGANEQTLLDQLMNQSGQGTGSQTAGPSSPAMEYLNKVLGGEFMPAGSTPGSLGAFADMFKGAQRETGYSTDEINPFLTAAIEAAQRPTLQGLEETLSRTLPGRFTQAGQFKQPGGSSAFDRAGAIATRGAGDAMADIATNLSYATMEAERGRQFEAQEGARSRESTALQDQLGRDFTGTENERNRQNEAAGLTTTVNAQEVDTLVKNLQAQALPRLIEEFGIERGMEQFTNRMNTLLATLGIGAGVTAPVIGQKSESTTKPNVMPALGAL